MKTILAPGRNAWCAAEASDAGLLIDAQEYYRAAYRAMRGARRSIALTGWQFDSDVALLRGAEAEAAGGEVRLLPMLEELCAANPELHVYILAWDYSVLFALEREWMQGAIFNWTTGERIHFRFDASAPLYGAHHQKLLLVDGALAFTGGMDVCDCRWDTREHAACNELRCDTGRKPHQPYHDVQAVLRGEAAHRLTELFEARWVQSGGGALALPRLERDDLSLEATLPLPAGPVAFSRTFGRTLVPPQEPVQEVRALYLDAIDAAERFVYVENQYFSSRAISQALARRFRAPGRSKLDVALVLPRTPEALKEQVAMGVEQARLLRALQELAEATGHRLGVYCNAATGEDGEDVYTYIHSKVMVVDDRFLTVGSANTTNRSLGLDSELNASWESTEAAPDALQDAIRRLRLELLGEHTGLGADGAQRAFGDGAGLVAALEREVERPGTRLRRHALETLFDTSPLLKPFAPSSLRIDPEDSVLDETFFESFRRDPHGFFASGMRVLTELLVGRVVDELPPAVRPVSADAPGAQGDAATEQANEEAAEEAAELAEPSTP